MATTIVKDSTGLVAALKSAHAGDVIQLASGTYASFDLRGVNIAGEVTITSQNAGAPAVLTGLYMDGNSGLTFKGLELQVNPNGIDNPFQVYNSTNIKFDHLNVHGTIDGNPQNDQGALIIRDSKNITVSNSEFQSLKTGVTHMDDTGLTITNNSFHEIRMDGIRGGGTSNVTISGNYFTNFSPVADDHPDAIQFWTTNTTVAAHDITVTGNVVARGAGAPIQGVFMRDEVGNLAFKNVTITSNLIVGGLYNGIAVNGGDGVKITDNTVVGMPDQKSWILTTGVTNGTLTNNHATTYQIDPSATVHETGDTTLATPTDGGKAIETAWLTAHPGVNSLATVSGLSAASDSIMKTITATINTLVNVTGTSGADRLYADGLHNTIVTAGDGNDVLTGGGIAHNTLIGGAGDDTYYVYSSNDVVQEQAGQGNDLVIAAGNYTLSDNVEGLRMTGDARYGGGNALDNRITGTAGDDSIDGFAGNDDLMGGDGNDRIDGGIGNDSLTGGGGNDTLIGGDGADRLDGGAGSDSLSGGAGNDYIEAGAGADTMSGGAGADVFFFRDGDLSKTPDRITDFSSADGDQINLRMIDANTNVAGDQAFTFINTTAFHHVAGELRVEFSGGVAHLFGDVNGDGVADFQLDVAGVSAFKPTDFLL